MRRLALATAVLLASGPVRAGEEPFLVNRTARAHYEQAGAQAERGDLRSAAASLDAAHAIEPHPELLFVRAELRRRLGECRTALILYREFIASTPSEAATLQAEAGVTACERSLGVAAPVIEPAPAPAPTPAPPPPPRPTAWRKDPAGGVLLGFGAASLAGAAGLAIGGALTASSAGEQAQQGAFERERRRALALQWSAGAAAAVGVGLIVGAALRYRAVHRRQRLAAWFDGRGVGLALTGRF